MMRTKGKNEENRPGTHTPLDTRNRELLETITTLAVSRSYSRRASVPALRV